MKLDLILFIFLLSSTSSIYSQCFPNGIAFNSQEEIDSFAINYPDCTKIEGYVSFYAPQGTITNCIGLSQVDSIGSSLILNNSIGFVSFEGWGNLKYIGGNLNVSESTEVLNFEGLNGLETIGGSLLIEEMTNLVSLSGLENLSSIGYDINIEENPNLASIAALENITSVPRELTIESNRKLESLDGLTSLVSVGTEVDIDNNLIMNNIDGLGNLTYIGSELEIRDNPNLIDLSGLSNLTTIDGNIEIINNDTLQNLSGLENLTSMNGPLEIIGNRELKSLEGIQNIVASGIEFLTITDCDSLSYCSVQSICDYIIMDLGPSDIQLNKSGCNTSMEIEDLCLNPTSTNPVVEQANNIYPNPTTNYLMINEENKFFNSYGIYTIAGKKIKSGIYSFSPIDVSILKNGIYFLELINENNKVVFKFIKY